MIPSKTLVPNPERGIDGTVHWHPARAWTGSRRGLLLLIALVAVAAGAWMGLNPATLLVDAQWHQLGAFLKAGLAPALAYEDPSPASQGTFLLELAVALYKTVVYAAAAIGLSLVGGVLFGFAGAANTWLSLIAPNHHPTFCPRFFALTGLFVVRTLMTVLRSVHEIVWAILFLQALGAEPLAAVIAIAIPYSATLGKVFSELIDETPRHAAQALRANGASLPQVFLFGLLPAVAPDLLAYLLYRFECGLRSAAVLGFFGAPTLGYYLSLSWGERHFHEVWTYLYALLILIVTFDIWSGAIRRRLTVRHAD